MSISYGGLLLLCLLYSLRLSLSQFVFEFILHAVTTHGECTGIDISELRDPECETYLFIFCLREGRDSKSTDDSDCPLGSVEEIDPEDIRLPTSKQILSGSSQWPVSRQLYYTLVLLHVYN